MERKRCNREGEIKRETLETARFSEERESGRATVDELQMIHREMKER